MKEYILYWSRIPDGKVDFARDGNYEVQLFTKEEAERFTKDGKVLMEKVGLAYAGITVSNTAST